jgi:repressor LexA
MMANEKEKEVLSRNLKKFLKLHKINSNELARKLDIPESTVSNWTTGQNYPRIDKIQLMADYFNIRKSDLTEEMNEDDSNIIRVEHNILIPVLGEIACGDPITAQENIEEYRERPANNLPSGDLFYLKTKGDSMEPKIPDNSYVLIREQADVENGEIAAVLVNGDTEATLKKVHKLDGIVLLEAVNEKYDP